MEQNCPVTSTVSNPVESPKPPLLASCGNAGSPKVERDSPEPNCAICLGKTENKSFTDSCLHQFCFNCLLEWSKVKAECPLCKQSFKSIIHNVRSNEEYEEYHVEGGRDSRYWQEVESNVVRFRYSTTLTPERHRERIFESLVGPFFFGTDAIPAQRVNRRVVNRRRYQAGTGDFRASVYREHLWVNPLPDVTGRYRECSPEFYRLNPAQLHRLVPWLNRELIVLRVPSSHLMMVVDLILGLLTQYSITSVEFQSRLVPHIGANTNHFIHEFYAFARSPYDMVGFDQSADYHIRHQAYATEVQAIESDSSDSDIIVLSPARSNTATAATTTAAAASSSSSSSSSFPPRPPTPGINVESPLPVLQSLNDIQPLNLSAGSSRPLPRLSPVAGPSSLDEDFILMITRELQNPTYPSLNRVGTFRSFTNLPGNSREIHSQIVESDSDDCVIVGYVKPRHERTPEIITLTSDVGSGNEDVRGHESVDESLKFLLSSTSSSTSSDTEYVPHQTRHKKKATPKRRKVQRPISSSSDESDSVEVRRQYISSSDSNSEAENGKHKKAKAKGKRKRVPVSTRDSTDDNKLDRNRNRNRKSRKEVWRIVRKQEPETDHDYSLDCYDPPYTEDEWASFSSDRPKLRSIVITKSAGANGQREASYSSVASSSRSSSHHHEGKRHRHKAHKRDTKKRKERRRSESSSPVRSSKGKRSKSKRLHRIEDSSS